MARIERLRERRARQWLAATVQERAVVSPIQQGDYRDAVLEWLADRVAWLEAEVAALKEALANSRPETAGTGEMAPPNAVEEAPEPQPVMGLHGERVPAGDVIEAVAEHIGVTTDVLAGDGRTRNLVEARHVACWLLRRLTGGLSFNEIGRLLGGRDHSTVMNSIRKVDADERLRAVAERIAAAQGWALAEQEAV